MTTVLTIFPNPPCVLVKGFNTLNIENFSLFWKIVNGIKTKKENSLVLGRNNKVLDLTKDVIFAGDLPSCDSPKIFYNRQILKKVENSISDENKHNLYILDREMRKIITREIFDFGLPLEVSTDWSINDIIKMMDLSYNVRHNNMPVEILGEFIDLSFFLSDRRIVLFTNLSNYLTETDRKQVAVECQSKEVTILSINLVRGSEYKSGAEENVIFIDNDFTMFEVH